MEKAKASIGRPADYTPDIGDIICEGISSGKSLVRICQDESLPSPRAVYRWLRVYDEFRHNYEMAKDDMADYMAEESIDIADNQVAQPLLVDGIPLEVDGKVVMVKDSVSVNHARLRIDTRKWYASKLKPKKYGERIAVAGEPDNPLTMIIKEIAGSTLGPKKNG